MSKSGMGYLLGSFRFSSASDSGHQDNNGWGGYGFLAHIIHDGSSAPLPSPSPIIIIWGGSEGRFRWPEACRSSKSAIAAEAFMDNAGSGYLR